MTTEEQTREILAQQRQAEKQRQDSMLNRAEAEVSDHAHADSQTEEKARELGSEHRQKQQQTEDSMSSRAEAEINPTDSN